MKLSRRDIVKLGVATGASTLLPDFLSAVDAETQYRVEGQSMVTCNVIQRVFKIRRGESQGTAFTIDRAGRHYLVTARHVIIHVEQTSLGVRDSVISEPHQVDARFTRLVRQLPLQPRQSTPGQPGVESSEMTCVDFGFDRITNDRDRPGDRQLALSHSGQFVR